MARCGLPTAGWVQSGGNAKLVERLRDQGVAILYISHRLNEILNFCDYVTVLNLGRVLATGTPAEIRVHKEVVSAYLGG